MKELKFMHISKQKSLASELPSEERLECSSPPTKDKNSKIKISAGMNHFNVFTYTKNELELMHMEGFLSKKNVLGRKH